MYKIGLALGLGLALMVNASDAQTGGRPFTVFMTGEQEAPGPGDPDGEGVARIQLNQGQGTVSFQILVRDIAEPGAAHIHRAPVGSPGPIVVDFDPDFTEVEPGVFVASGVVENVDPALLREIRQHPSRFYINVHNSEFPAGAVRGQLGK